jgi:hypothetical protein
MTLGGREYPLLPTFGVYETFEDRFGSLMRHLINLQDFTATLKARSYLVFLAIKADREDTGQDTELLSWEATHKAMWEAGPAVGHVPAKEVELIERLLYSPEQYLRKKEEEAAMQKANEQVERLIAGLNESSATPSPS